MAIRTVVNISSQSSSKEEESSEVIGGVYI